MNFELVEIEYVSGDCCQIFSVKLAGEDDTLFEKFVKEYIGKYENEVINIYNRLKAIGNKTGARSQFFKENAGCPGDGVCALYDMPKSKLRLYCIRYGNVAVVLGSGGFKSKSTRAWQDDSILKINAELMKHVSVKINKTIQEKEIKVTEKGLEGELIFLDDYE